MTKKCNKIKVLYNENDFDNGKKIESYNFFTIEKAG